MINSIIIDDELKSAISLKWELTHFSNEISVEGTFTNTKDALVYLSHNSIDCVFLDIEMPEMDGFEFLNHFPQRQFCVIFVTAYDGYAINAIKAKASDYLLKPVDVDELGETISKIKHFLKTYKTSGVSNTLPDKNLKHKVKLVIEGSLKIFDASNILYCKSDGNYCHLFLSDDQHYMVSKKLKEVETQLKQNFFVRVHHSYNVNMTKVKSFNQSDNELILQNNKIIPVSRANKKRVKNILMNGI